MGVCEVNSVDNVVICGLLQLLDCSFCDFFYKAERVASSATDHSLQPILINPCIPTVILHPWVTAGESPFLGHTRTNLQRLHPCFGGKIFLRCIMLCFLSRCVPEVDIAKTETGNYNICGHRRATLEFPVSDSTFLSTSCSLHSNFVQSFTKAVAQPVHYKCSRSKVKGQGHRVKVQGHSVT